MRKLFILFVFIVSASFHTPLETHKDYSEEVSEIKEMAAIHAYNTNYAFLVDYSIPSGKKRFFIYNLYTDEIEEGFLVAHGDGCESTNGTPTFSNTVGSNCSSGGIAVLGERDYSNWGINVKYWLDGMDYTNSNLRERIIVLHSWWGIPDVEVYPFNIPESQGCFTVSNDTMKFLDEFIQQQKDKRILIYSFK